MTSEQRRNVMACRKIAQQRVLRIMQEQTSKQGEDAPLEPVAGRDKTGSVRRARAAQQNSEKGGF